MDTVELGDKVEDMVTGFAGIVVSTTNYLNGCTRIAVQPQTLFEGQPAKESWFDSPQLLIKEKGAVQMEAQEGEKGGPAYLKDPGREVPSRDPA